MLLSLPNGAQGLLQVAGGNSLLSWNPWLAYLLSAAGFSWRARYAWLKVAGLMALIHKVVCVGDVKVKSEHQATHSISHHQHH